MEFRDAQEAFKNAINTNKLSEDQKEKNFAGNYMYMHSSEDLKTDFFKHIDTRAYIEVPNK